jgi:hypothetical protein
LVVQKLAILPEALAVDKVGTHGTCVLKLAVLTETFATQKVTTRLRAATTSATQLKRRRFPMRRELSMMIRRLLVVMMRHHRWATLLHHGRRSTKARIVISVSGVATSAIRRVRGLLARRHLHHSWRRWLLIHWLAIRN